MEHKTDWKLKDTVTPGDMNRIEGNIKELETPSFNDSGTVSDINSFTDFVNSVKSKMSIFDFFRNFKAGLKYIVHQGQIINSQDVTQAGFAMDARQANPNIPGSLGAKISDLNKNINSIERFIVTTKTTLNEITEWLMSKFETGIRSLNIFQGEKILLFGQMGNFNIICTKFVNADQFTGIAINHWDRNVFSIGIDSSKNLEWKKLTTNSDFVPQVFHVTTVANKSTEIVNSPTTPNYLPIITSVSNSTAHQTTITYNGGKWYIYSNYSQTVQIHFYKIPN